MKTLLILSALVVSGSLFANNAQADDLSTDVMNKVVADHDKGMASDAHVASPPHANVRKDVKSVEVKKSGSSSAASPVAALQRHPVPSSARKEPKRDSKKND